jgi:multidrug efflux pump subunit AcrB
MGLAFGAALLLIYLLIVAQFQSFVIPLVIMAPIPLTLVGIVPGHWMTGSYFTATSMIGFIALAGIIVRNSILLVDFILTEQQDGQELSDAVIRAGAVRTRPILLTAAALMVGAFVILFDPIFQGLAISLLFGVFASTLLTLIVIPVIYVSWREWEGRRTKT